MAPIAGRGSFSDSCPIEAPSGRFNERSCGTGSQQPIPPRKKWLEKLENKSMPTIPSRYEVHILPGDREHKGFGACALRFDAVRPDREDNPGPGNYTQQKAFHEECIEKVSWGKKGTGGFASKSRRFGARSMPSMPRAGLGCPGPGAYETMRAVTLAKEPKDFNQAKHSAVFNDTQTCSRMPLFEDTAPGPGQYYPQEHSVAQAASAAQAAFLSKSVRGADAAAVIAGDLPGPGDYGNAGFRGMAEMPIADGASAVFRHSSQQRLLPVHRDLPAASSRARQLLGSFGDEVAKPCLGTEGAKANMPGPGHYDRNDTFQSKYESAVASSSFQAGPGRTEWANAEVRQLPGPGRYNPSKVAGGMKLTSAVSSFSSVVERNKVPSAQAPGPAYYVPSLPKEKRSFRTRSSDRQWLG